MIRITLVRKEWVSLGGRVTPARTIVREFNDDACAAEWFAYDSYFAEHYTVSATWERIAK